LIRWRVCFSGWRERRLQPWCDSLSCKALDNDYCS
jgi:hypothetical protein